MNKEFIINLVIIITLTIGIISIVYYGITFSKNNNTRLAFEMSPCDTDYQILVENDSIYVFKCKDLVAKKKIDMRNPEWLEKIIIDDQQ